jgi:TrmH family RNA methyltransferase
VSEHRRPPEERDLIVSPGNEQVRFVKSLYRTTTRRHEHLFVAEGVRLLEEALAAHQVPELVLVAPDQLTRTVRGAELLERLRGFRTLTVTESVLKTISDTVTPQGVIAVFAEPAPTKAPPLGAVTLVLDGLRDPGNAGAALRSAEASGIVSTVAFVDSVDAFGAKVVRAAMGAHFRLTILDHLTWNSLLPILGQRPRYLAVADGPARSYDQVDWRRDSVLIIGGEAEGAGEAARALATERIVIPMAGSAESLNAAMAGTILLFEAARQRRGAGLLREPRTDAPEPASQPERPAPARPAVVRREVRPAPSRAVTPPPAIGKPETPRPARPRPADGVGRPRRPSGEKPSRPTPTGPAAERPPRKRPERSPESPPTPRGQGPRSRSIPPPPSGRPDFTRRRRPPSDEGPAGAKPTRPKR